MLNVRYEYGHIGISPRRARKEKKVHRTCLTKEHGSLAGKYANLQEEPEKHLERVARWTIF